MTLLATIAPALRATRVPPIAAVREGAVMPRSRLAGAAPRLAVAILVAAVAALALGSLRPRAGHRRDAARDRRWLRRALPRRRAGGAAARAAAGGGVGAPGRRLAGAAGALAQRNATRNPGRTASTAAALMIGLALVTIVATLGAGLRHSTSAALTEQVRADYVVTAEDGFSRFSAQAGTAPPNLPGVGVASAVLEDQARVLGGEASVSGIDPATIGRTYAFTWADGAPKAASPSSAHGGALVKQSFADRHGLRPGSTFTLTTPSDRRVAVTVAGIFAPPAFDKLSPVLGSIVISRHTFASAFPRPRLRYGFVKLAPGARPHAAELLGRAIARYPGARVQTRDELGRRAGGGDRQAAEPALRAARAVGRREPVRHGQHARARRLRADARARDAAHGRA